METFFDKYNILHHIPVIDGNPETSENGPFFLGAWITEKKELTENEAWEFLASVGFLYDTVAMQFTTTPVSDPDAGFSHDNFKGIICGLLTIKRKFKNEKGLVEVANGLLKRVPLFHSQLDHPRDFVLIGFAKYPWIFFFLLWIPAIAFWITCWQTYKVRNGNQIIKTDGKIIARICCKSMNLKFTFWICDKILKRWREGLAPSGKFERWKWLSWFQVYAYYFKDKRHPILVEVWE